MPVDSLSFPDGETEWPDGFIGENATEEQFTDLENIRRAVGSPLQPLIASIEAITQRGQVGQMRGIRFATGADALIWLFHRGIFLFSNVVSFADGTWGVRIGDSTGAGSEGGEDNEQDSILF